MAVGCSDSGANGISSIQSTVQSECIAVEATTNTANEKKGAQQFYQSAQQLQTIFSIFCMHIELILNYKLCCVYTTFLNVSSLLYNFTWSMVHLLEIPLEITGNDDITSYFWTGRPSTM